MNGVSGQRLCAFADATNPLKCGMEALYRMASGAASSICRVKSSAVSTRRDSNAIPARISMRICNDLDILDDQDLIHLRSSQDEALPPNELPHRANLRTQEGSFCLRSVIENQAKVIRSREIEWL